ncbi:hypothetical protein [Pseudarthrobacter sp. LMD1-1-1.1]|uniref:hypothetical protein n=1 Tax=Pseudarthrobacter sp. LMD1-1-1.1 TaxID=3135242 RepID=UPI003438E62E
MTEELSMEPLNWTVRNGSMPVMPGSSRDFKEHLKAVLSSVKRDVFNDPQTSMRDTSGKTRPLSWYANQLAPAGLLKRQPDLGIQLTPFALAWLETDSPEILARVFHRHNRYIGELMSHLADGPRTIVQLTALANTDFRLGWKSNDPVRRRVSWLTNLGFLYDAGDLRHGLTESGMELLKSLSVAEPALLWPEQSASEQVELSRPGPEVAGLLDALRSDDSEHDRRGHVVSYIPTSSGMTAVDSLKLLTSAAIPEINVENFDALCTQQFGIKSSSAKSALTTMRTLGLYRAAGRNRFTASPAAQEWLDGGDDTALIRIAHYHVRFVGELLRHVDSLKRAPNLHELAASEYGVEAANSSTTSRLMQLLYATGMIHDVAYAQYETTPLGRLLREELPLATPKSERERAAILSGLAPSEVVSDLDSLVAELREASVDSANPTRFEKSIVAAFESLGVSARHLGGAGRTDVLVDLGVGAVSSGRAIVDGKSAGSGIVTEKAISFQALREHRKKHAAKYAAVVAPSFQEGRLHEWAHEEDVALISIDQLVTVLQRQLVTPLAPSEVALLFKPSDGWANLVDLWDGYDRTNELTRLVVASLVREAKEDDPLLGSSLDTRSIYRELRDHIHPRPSEEELQGVLSFLSAPFVRLVEAGKTGYTLLESPATAAYRLRSLSRVLESTTE